MTEQQDQWRIAYITMAAVAGAVTALSFMRWKDMAWSEICLTLFVGSAFAIFAVPWIAADFLKIDITPLRAICFFTYIGGAGANSFVPVLIRKAKSIAGERTP